MRYKAFISYSHTDEKWAAWLQRRLEHFRYPQGPDAYPLRPVFRDRSELAVGELTPAIEAALEASDALIVICSPAAAQSPWVSREVETFEAVHGAERILPLVVKGADGAYADSFPAPLRAREMLAADVRADKDGRQDAFLKIAAALIDVRFDELKRRADRRRTRQLLTVAGGAVAVAVVTVGLAIAALLARQEAEQRRDQAEGLVTFMIGDVRDRLDDIGRLDIMEAVGDEALEYFESLDAEQITPEGLLQRGRALRQIGDVRASQGRPDDALTLYDAALEIFSRATPRDSGVLFEQAQTHLAASGVHYGRRDLPQSTTETLRFRELMAMLVERNPGSGDYLAELATADNNLGALAMADSDTDAADAHFRNALATVERLIAESPNDAGLRTLAARLQIWLGEVEDRRGHVDESLTWYRDGLEQHRVAVRLEATPANREALSSTLTILTVALRENDPRASLAYADDAIAELRALTAHDPDNADWRMRLNRAIVIAVGSELELGCAARIPKLLAEVRDSTDALLANDATGIENLRNRVDADVLAARYAIGMADLDEAAARADAAARQAAVLLERNPDDDISRRYYLRAVWVQVRSRRLTGAADAGRRAAQDAVAIIGHDAIEDPATATVAERLRAVAAGASGSEPAGRGNRCDGG